MKVRIFYFLILVLSLCKCGYSIAQDSTAINNITQTVAAIIINEKNTDVQYFIPENTKIKLWIKGHPKAYKGELKIINESRIEVDGRSFLISQIEQIKVKGKGHTTGVVLMSLGGVSLAAGILIMSGGSGSTGNPVVDLTSGLLSEIGRIIFGVGGIAAGVVYTIAGSSIMISSTERYDQATNSFSIGQVTVSLNE